MEQVNKEELALISMNVILHAGNARDYVFQAVDKASNGEFNQADELMKKADEEIVIAHKAQTNTLQKEAEGIEIPFSPLFGHAQDTLMTVKSEMNIMREIIKLYKKI
ncbi:PTS lactose/cellobiose transporter subunit IIA [Heyndrickxia oleronia]|jgi:PTS system cellobiose-specific IIA component|uniref:PTS lactose/cellobiose transporter subunit IIA n=1 Tax=Heyndrickxia oleronia TaxID=38875 RepID=A0A8E2IC41_9BACI|nr:PTS lactose/cellobiose transporter subunit IIA [Heyndrickxia oleronia]NYV64170.1 PTS lactose/cellobiose transporter subunit IIA [Bacillus sp. Gen3]OJH16330.1 PTS lactose/cellobiose transporter subunit IIA [Bacillus obstructivus]MBU5214084.1 PTS lactose/cellobiose transporter subunit IIA [Heyndrickxia oleronia]MCM3455776.1 PTS lactose/cellobiose transporter subunit IIA [Heyndrickxia oleronia]MEC1375454.1 PTS lactose/cellobiose transporter subunit IIA [Heyndrickxia oleronia]